MKRIYVTGTDTGAGKTRAVAALARAARIGGDRSLTIVKLVQTGLAPEETGDAEYAGALAGCAWRELHRFSLAGDPWAAALENGTEPLRAAALATELAMLPDTVIVEGSGGAAVPLNATESIGDALRAGDCNVILVVGLRLGCISHALLSLDYLRRRGFSLRGAILCEAFGSTSAAYRHHVERCVAPHVRATATIAFAPNARAGIEADARAVTALLAT